MTATFNEEFEIVIGVHDESEAYDYKTREFSSGYTEGLANILSEIGTSNEEIGHEVTEVGVGASALAICLIISGVFLAGKRMEENLDAWIKLAKRLGGVLKKLAKLGDTNAVVYISEPFAAALALAQVVGLVSDIKAVGLMSSVIHQVPNTSIGAQYRGIFRYDQMRHYVFTFRVVSDGESVHLIGVRSTGGIEFHHVFHTGDWMKFYDLD